MVLVTMNDAVRESTYKIYTDLLNEFRNPNGCKIKATFFVSHTATEYKYVKQLAYHGRNKFPHTLIIFIQMFSVIAFQRIHKTHESETRLPNTQDKREIPP